MLRPKSEREVQEKLVKRFWQLVNEVVPLLAAEEIKQRSDAGYDEIPFWHTYAFPEGVLAQASHKLARLSATCASTSPKGLLTPANFDTLWDNAIGLINYAKMFAALLTLLREEEEA